MTGKYEAIGTRIGRLTDEKNESYGDSFNKCAQFLELLYPNGVTVKQFRHMLGNIRVFDKQMRLANRPDAFGESPWADIAGYGILGAANDEVEK